MLLIGQNEKLFLKVTVKTEKKMIKKTELTQPRTKAGHKVLMAKTSTKKRKKN